MTISLKIDPYPRLSGGLPAFFFLSRFHPSVSLQGARKLISAPMPLPFLICGAGQDSCAFTSLALWTMLADILSFVLGRLTFSSSLLAFLILSLLLSLSLWTRGDTCGKSSEEFQYKSLRLFPCRGS